MPPTVTVPTVPPLARLDRVELARAGTWNIAVGGTQTFTGGDFAAAVAALDCPAVRRPVIKLGHLDSRGPGLARLDNDDGEPALGWVANLGVTSDRTVLVSDLVGMPGWLGQIAASAYPDRSIEGYRNYRCQIGHIHPFVLSAVALLGVTPPGVGVLGSLQDHVRALYGVAAATDTDVTGGEPFAFTFHATEEAPVPTSRPQLVAAAAVTVDELRTAFHQSSPWDYWITEIQLDPLQLIVTSDSNGETYRVPVTIGADGDSFTFGAPVPVEVTYVDETADEPVAAAAPLTIAFRSRARSRPADARPTVPTWPPAPVAASDPAPPPAAVAPPAPAQPVPPPPVPAPADPVIPAAEPVTTTEPEGGAVVSLSAFRSRLGLDETADEAAVLAALDERLAAKPEPTPDPQLVAASAAKEEQFAAALGQINTLSTELAQIKAAKAADEKNAFFAAAIRQGKIAPADRVEWELDYDKSPEVVTRILGAIKVGTAVPVAAAGYVGNPEQTPTDDDLMGLFSPEARALLVDAKGA